MKPLFSIIVAVDKKRGISLKRKLPWKLREDIKWFKHTTLLAPKGKKNSVIMGRKTYFSIPKNYRPLQGRDNIILSKKKYPKEKEVSFFSNFQSTLNQLTNKSNVHQIFVIGGGEVYQMAISHPNCHSLYITEVQHTFDCDTFFPPYLEQFKKQKMIQKGKEDSLIYKIEHYVNVNFL